MDGQTTRRRLNRWRAGVAGAAAVALLVAGCSTAPAAETPGGSFDSATADDAAFTAVFEHEFTDVDGIGMHYVTGGEGPPLVLLHGWPQSWFAWRGVMPALAEQYTVYALDLPGLGDSEGAPASYDKATLAGHVHELLVEQLGLTDLRVVGHDLGAGVGFQLASRFPEDVAAIAHLDVPLPGPALSAQQYRALSWHVAFHAQRGFPETLVDDDVPAYLAEFFPYVAFGGVSFGGPGAQTPFTDAQVAEYVRTYSRPQVLTGGFELYRTLDQDEQDNLAAAPVTAPTLLLTAEGGRSFIEPSVTPLMAIERAVEVPGAGHWLMEENPAFVTAELLAFFDR